MFLIEVVIEFDSKSQAQRFAKSIKPELKEEFARSTTKVALRQASLVFEVSASDKTALRASLNALLKPLVLFSQLEEL